MIKLFGETDKDFASNGDKIIIPLKAVVHKEDNGDYYIDIDTDLSYVEDLTEGRIIIVPTPQGEQAFRVGNVEKTRKKMSTRCYHVFYDTKNYLIFDSFVVDKNCNDALDWLNGATDTTSPFITVSNNSTVNSFRCVRKSLYEAIQTVVERWGGHLVRDNFSIGIMDTIGQDNGVTVRYRKNLKEITCTENWDSVVTKLLPVGQDGIMLNSIDSSVDPYLYSETTYSLPYTKTVSFDQEIDQELFQNDEGNLDEDAYNQALIDDLRNQAQAYLEENCVPQVNYTLKANLEKITDVGDTVVVVDERLGIDIFTNVISYDYDCILGKYKEIEFGNFTNKLSGLLGDINTNVTNAVTEGNNNLSITLTQDLNKATGEIWAALGGSNVIYDGDKILVVDRLPKEAAVNVLMINSGGISFSNSGVNGNFITAWSIDNVLNMEAVNVVNLVADLIKGGTLRIGSNLNVRGTVEVHDVGNTLIARMDKNGLLVYGLDGSYVVMNNSVGFCGYDRIGNKIFWATQDEFHVKKSVVEEEMKLFGKARFLPITIIRTIDGRILTDGVGFVAGG